MPCYLFDLWNRSLKIPAKRKKSDQPMHNYSRHHFVCLSMQNKLQLHLISQAGQQKLFIVSKIVPIMFDLSGLQGLDNLGTKYMSGSLVRIYYLTNVFYFPNNFKRDLGLLDQERQADFIGHDQYQRLPDQNDILVLCAVIPTKIFETSLYNPKVQIDRSFDPQSLHLPNRLLFR